MSESSVVCAKKPIIMIVDDKPLNIHVLAEALKENYRVKIATSGEKALDIVEHDELPDLIVLDIMMPKMDGYEVCRRLKENESTSDIPVIFVTAKDSAADEEKGLELGAVDYISKPFNLATVRARVKTHLALKLKTDLLNSLTSIDGLTGIANRRAFDATLDKEWRRALRAREPLSLLMVDVDFFKQYNDSYGHWDGDTCLRRIAGALSAEMRRPADLVARYGGEEFVVLLPGLDAKSAAYMAEKIRVGVEFLQIEHRSSSVLPYVTISVGCATLDAQCRTSDAAHALINLADKNLYIAKSSGRNRTYCHGCEDYIDAPGFTI
ncbi:diguanylate cyclase [Pseudomonadota bacterium]